MTWRDPYQILSKVTAKRGIRVPDDELRAKAWDIKCFAVQFEPEYSALIDLLTAQIERWEEQFGSERTRFADVFSVMDAG